MNRFRDDLRYAVRQLTKSPAFTTVAVVTLALGIGANTAIFSVIDAVLLRPLPYADPGRLVTIDHFYPSLNNLKAGVSPPGFRDYAGQTQLFSVSAVETGWVPSLTGRGDPTRVFGGQVSGRHFEMLGVAPALGRALRPDEATAGHDKVVVLSDGFWKRVFGGRAEAIGQLVVLNGESYEVVGVMPPSFRDEWSRQAEFWAPLVLPDSLFADSRRGNEFLVFTGRLKPGVTVDQAQADLHALATRLKKDYPNNYSPDWDLLLATVADKTSGPLRSSLYLLLGAVGFVLLIACANVANLQLARAAVRSREIAVRLALGASSRDLLRLLLTESVVLSLVGGAVGLLLALWGVPALVAINSNGLPPGSEIGLDVRVLGYTLLLSVLTGVLFGLAPALQLARTNLQSTLKEGGRGSAGDRGGQRLRRGLVIGTVSLALTLLAGAGLLIRSFAAVSEVNPGFRPDHLLTLNVSLPSARYSERHRDARLLRPADSGSECGPRSHLGRRHLGHAVHQQLVDEQLQCRGLHLAQGGTGPMGRRPAGDPRVPGDTWDPSGKGALPQCAGHPGCPRGGGRRPGSGRPLLEERGPDRQTDHLRRSRARFHRQVDPGGRGSGSRDARRARRPAPGAGLPAGGAGHLLVIGPRDSHHR